MMRSQLGIAVCAILLAGSSSGDSVQPHAAIQTLLKEGDRLIVKVITFDDPIIKCYMKSPSGLINEFTYTDEEDSNEKFIRQHSSDNLIRCRGSMRIDANDSGLWTLVSEADTGRQRNQLYNVTVSPRSSGNAAQSRPIQASINEGDRVIVQVLTFDDSVIKCYMKSPSGLINEFTSDYDEDFNEKFIRLPTIDNLIRCRGSLRIDGDDTGLWTLVSESYTGRERIQMYNVTVIPGTGDHRTVDYLNEKSINTAIGSSHTISIPYEYMFDENLMCSIITPHGNEYNIEHLENLDFEGIAKDPSKRCSVILNVTSENDIGRWMLISDGEESSKRIERRLPFIIIVEVIVDAAVDVIDVREGNNMFINLRNIISHRFIKTCRLLGPDGTPPAQYHQLKNTCGFEVNNVTESDNGNWEINYGDTITYRAIVRVIVHDAPVMERISLSWIQDSKVNVTIGPNTAIYCKVKSPEGLVVYNAFGRCQIALDRVTRYEHEGLWKMDVGLPGQVVTHEYKVTVVVTETKPKAKVTTTVFTDVNDKHTITISCSLASENAVHSCKFRSPSGRVLIAAEGVGENRYSWHGTGTNYTAGVHQHDCGIRITSAVISDLGIWRCALDTEGGTHFGFLTVRGTWIRDPEIAATVTTTPILTADRNFIDSMVEDSVIMTCSVQAPIRYCYFRSRNGSLFNVAPSASHDLATYVGAGLDAGECGIRFPSLAVSDSGYWSCHVGFLDPEAPEQRARFEVSINDVMVAKQSMKSNGNRLTLKAQVFNERPLDYCRFVRIDGFGFTNENVPSSIDNWSYLNTGLCSISIVNPSNLDLHPWAIVAKIRGRETEVTRITDIAFNIPIPPGGGGGGTVHVRIPGAWIIVMSIGMCMILLAMFIGPKKNREWTMTRAGALRNSFTTKKVEQNANDASKNTAVAA